MFSIGEDWVSHLKINGSGNGFMENMYDHGFLFIYCMIQGTNKKIFWPYVEWLSLIVRSSPKHKFSRISSIVVTHP
jgi:hypothetical protein